MTFAAILNSENIPVSLVVTIDPAHASPKVPLNVERYVNIFLSDSVLGERRCMCGSRVIKGHYASFDLKQHEEVTHINIDKMEIRVHAQLVIAIAATCGRRPCRLRRESMPLRYVVPPGCAPLELWDSGTAQLAHSGDTLQRLAALNHVPLWSLSQANQLSDSVPLTAGQRVVVPRRLASLIATSAGLPPKR